MTRRIHLRTDTDGSLVVIAPPRMTRTDIQHILQNRVARVMRFLEKDRKRRYETANGFAQDVRRYLDDEPIMARPPSNLYRLRKFVHKNRGTQQDVTAVRAYSAARQVRQIWFCQLDLAAHRDTDAAQPLATKVLLRAVRSEFLRPLICVPHL